jgi:hypothetical protein
MNMTTKLKIVFVSFTLLLLLAILLILIFRILGAPANRAPFFVPYAWMTLCSSGNRNETEAACSESPKMNSFSSAQGSDICVAWIESNREEQHKISIHIIDQNDPSSLIKFEGPPAISLERDACRMEPVPISLSPGKYQTKIISENRVIAGEDVPLIWIINTDQGILPRPNIQEPRLTLTTTTNPKSYQRVGDNITYNYRITNTGPFAVDSPQFVINDSKFDFPINCGTPNTSLAPSASLVCSASYKITQADIEAGSVTSTASVQGNIEEPVTTVLTSNCQAPKDWVLYEIRSTDTLDTIRSWYPDLTLEEVMQANCLNKSTVSPGQKIYVPGTPLSAKIIGMVFMDPNHNDIQDRGEIGLAGTPVKITDSLGTIVATLNTGANGSFELDLPPGTYFVYQFQIILQPGEVRNQKFAVVPVPGN